MSTKIKAITFDFWSTLYRGRGNHINRLHNLQKRIEQASGNPIILEALEAAIEVSKTMWQEAWIKENRTLPASHWLDVILTELRLIVPDEARIEISDSIENALLEYPPILETEVPNLLVDLAADYKLAIISDTGVTPGRVLRHILTQDAIIDHFTHLTFSDELGRSKPHQEAFLSTLKALDAEPTEAIHIGDLLRTDIAGAKGVGMRAVQYVGISRDEPLDGRSVEPDAVITSFTELKTLLKQWEI